MVFYLNKAFPIELKYKTAKLTFTKDDEIFNLKNHGAQDLGKYDCLKDLQRLETLLDLLSAFSSGYTIWLTNETSYWNPPSRANTVYEAFSIHQTAQKHGCMEWTSHVGKGTIKGREKPITLNGTYEISWHPYSDLGTKNGIFKYAVLADRNSIKPVSQREKTGHKPSIHAGLRHPLFYSHSTSISFQMAIICILNSLL